MVRSPGVVRRAGIPSLVILGPDLEELGHYAVAFSQDEWTALVLVGEEDFTRLRIVNGWRMLMSQLVIQQ